MIARSAERYGRPHGLQDFRSVHLSLGIFLLILEWGGLTLTYGQTYKSTLVIYNNAHEVGYGGGTHLEGYVAKFNQLEFRPNHSSMFEGDAPAPGTYQLTIQLPKYPGYEGYDITLDHLETNYRSFETGQDIKSTLKPDASGAFTVQIREKGSNYFEFYFVTVPKGKEPSNFTMACEAIPVDDAPPLGGRVVQNHADTITTTSASTTAQQASGLQKRLDSPASGRSTGPSRAAGMGAGFGPREDNTTFSGGKNIRFFGTNDLAQCETACAADPQCKAYTVVKRGAYESNPNNAVCYLSSSFANRVHSSCCISAVKVPE